MRAFYYITALVIVAGSFFLTFRQVVLEPEVRASDNACESTRDLVYQKFLLNIQFGNAISFSNKGIIKDEDNNILYIKSLLKSGPVLFFRATESNCSNCITSEIDALNDLTKIVGKEKVVILLSSSGINDLKIFKKVHKISSQIFQISQEAMNQNAIERVNLPYYFVMEEGINSDMVFIPENGLPQLSQSYLELIKRRLLAATK